MKSTVIWMLMAPLALSLACGGGDDDGNGNGNGNGNGSVDAGVSPQCMEATTQSDLAWIQENIFTQSCTFGPCHDASNPADGLNLEPGAAEAALVGINSTRDAAYQLVEAGNADDSYLLMVMGRDPAGNNPNIVRTMPAANPVLCDEKLEAMARWINSL